MATIETPPLDARPPRSRWRDYLELTKPRVVALMVFTVVVGMLLATPSALSPWRCWCSRTLGIALVAGSAAAINHLVDRRVDALMARTRWRPLPSGALGGAQVLLFAVALGAARHGAAAASFTNPLCAVLTFASLLGYAVVYSMYLKRATPQNIVIGGAAGAAPPLLGWVAVTGQLDAGRAAAVPDHLRSGRRRTSGRWRSTAATSTRAPRSRCCRSPTASRSPPAHPGLHRWRSGRSRLLPFAIGMSGWLYLAGAVLLGARFVWLAARLRRDARLAMPTFRFSIVYLFALFAVLLADHYLLLA